MSAPTPGYRYRGLLWPGLLILVGGIALLVNTNVISTDRLYRLGDLWPVLLIVIGLEMFVLRSPMPGNASAIAGALIVLVALGGAFAYMAAGPALPSGIQTMDRSAPAGKLDHGSVSIAVGGATLHIRGADLEGDLFRAHINYSGPAPGVSVNRSDGHIDISQSGGFHLFGPQRFAMDLQLSTSVRWSLDVRSGGTNDTYDFTKLRLVSLVDATGGSLEDISLGAPKGNVPITINGGGLTVHLHRPPDTAAQVTVSGGAVTLDYDGHQQRGVGSLSDGMRSDTDMFSIRISAGACTVTMDVQG